MVRPITSFIAACLLLLASAAAADTPRTITWDDLIPADANYPLDPLSKLTDRQKDDLGYLFRLKQAGAGFVDNAGLAQEARELEDELRREGVQIERLIAELRRWEAERERVDRMVVDDLNGKLVKMPGYVLPLEYAGKKVTQFLLVPFVGACVHVPPPPPNQIVHVTTADGFEDSGLFTPVYVTGRLSATSVASRSLFLKDGNVDVSFGYALEGVRIERYRE